MPIMMRSGAHSRDGRPGRGNDMSHTSVDPSPLGAESARHDNTVLTIGWILTTVGILCTVASFLLMML
ncbi:hypothetical protein ASG92_21385 [Arthrobacter sp. Soil736]|nr:hypothetical protein ASG92_21385 [Arthrobacter sp. Soil736]